MAKVIIDTLPTGLTLYTGADTLNGVTKNGTALTTGVTFGGTTAPTVTVAATEIAAGDVIIATLDTYVSDSASITVDTDITNNSAVSFSTAATGKYVSSGGAVNFQLTGTNDLNLAAPATILPSATGTQLQLQFTASDNIGALQSITDKATLSIGGAGQNVTVTIPNYMLLLPGNPVKKLLVIIEAQFNSL